MHECSVADLQKPAPSLRIGDGRDGVLFDPVLVAPSVVTGRITNDLGGGWTAGRQAAEFAIPFVPRPTNPALTRRARTYHGPPWQRDQVGFRLQDDYADTYVRGVRYHVPAVGIPGEADVGGGGRDVYFPATTERLTCTAGAVTFAITARRRCSPGCWPFAVYTPVQTLAEQTRSIKRGRRAPRGSTAPAKPSRSPRRARHALQHRNRPSQGEALASA